MERSLKIDSIELLIKRLKPECTVLAKEITDGIKTRIIDKYSTLSIERSLLRVAGLNGVSSDGFPLCNFVIDQLKENNLLKYGASIFVGKALKDGQSLEDMDEQKATKVISQLKAIDQYEQEEFYHI